MWILLFADGIFDLTVIGRTILTLLCKLIVMKVEDCVANGVILLVLQARWYFGEVIIR